MKSVEYTGDNVDKKTAYEFSRDEFDSVVRNLVNFGNIAKTAIIRSNDPQLRRRPRLKPAKHAVEILHDVLGEDAFTHGSEMSELDAMRYERLEIVMARREASMGVNDRSRILLGLFTTAVVFSELRGPLLADSEHLVDKDTVESLMNQFYDDEAQRVRDAVM